MVEYVVIYVSLCAAAFSMDNFNGIFILAQKKNIDWKEKFREHLLDSNMYTRAMCIYPLGFFF